jgi:hypothetical protein
LFGEDGVDPFGSVTVTGEGGIIARVDAGADAVADALPPLDVRPPVDVYRNDCPDADALLVYTITESYNLQSFNPDNGQFRTIGRITCPITEPGATPFSMAVDRKGVAYVLFNDEHLYRVSTLTGACLATEYVPRQSNFGLFGMGFATDQAGPSETLYIAGVDEPYGFHPLGAGGLARLNVDRFNLEFVSEFPGISKAELTGTGGGHLYAFYKKPGPSGATADGPPSYIGEIDPASAAVIGERRFDTVDQGTGWAFAFWGGDFYMFHAPNGNTTLVTRYRPSDESLTQVAATPEKIVGAGVSTCAPQQ